ncbi:MAG: alanine--tRNA ligase [Clostridiaceae bacterium]|nr:alanine--tRNA ligase [Clostridiaceae bacterium]
MKSMGLNELREKYLEFFETKQHLILPSFSLIPKNDPSILLVNAGMTPLKPYFTGAESPPSKRIATCQKCVRTQDIDIVGSTARHATFFEMLGNFSFGDYFKEEAISWAWEFCTEVLHMSEDRLYITIYEEDDEAFDIWHDQVGIPSEKIFRFGKEDNFWEHGTGPCGPCSELFYDRGEKYGCGDPNCTVGCECDRFIEFWNLVFTQFEKDEEGNYHPLKNKNIDTGCGLERLASIMQDVGTIFEVDTVKAILDRTCELANVTYGQSEDIDAAIRVITDHVRSTVFMISDGIEPSNERRGYVLRRLIRRAARYGLKLGIEDSFLTDLAKIAIDQSKSAYPELEDRYDYIMRVITQEEKSFARTIRQGTEILNRYLAESKDKNLNELSGEQVFKLHDTYGFPVDLTREIAAEKGIIIDTEGFNQLMAEQKERARKATLANTDSAWDDSSLPEVVDQSQETKFLGYDVTELEATVLYLLQNTDNGLEVIETASKDEPVIIISDQTPFYAEAGGQVGDTGLIQDGHSKVKIQTVTKNGSNIYLHQGVVLEGTIESGTQMTFSVDAKTRLETERNHTGTHILHQALYQVLGEHVEQAGSLVEANRLRFDFKHFEPVNRDELNKIEHICNEAILADIPVTTELMGLAEAKQAGARALFGEKYSDNVRVVSIGDFSKELCGGTHLDHSSQIGSLRITSETGIAAGVRRIEAVTGTYAYDYSTNEAEIIKNISEMLKSGPDKIIERVEQLQDKQKELEKEISTIKASQATQKADELIKNVETIGEIKVTFSKLENAEANQLRQTGDQMRAHFQSEPYMIVLASENQNNVIWLIMANKEAVEHGVHAGNIIREAAKITGGGGGGRPDMAQAGGKDASKIDQAFAFIREKIKEI